MPQLAFSASKLFKGLINFFCVDLALAGGAGLYLYLLMRKEEDGKREVQEGVTSRQEMRIPKDIVGIVIGREGSSIKYGAVM
jgi:hypothetical protein